MRIEKGFRPSERLDFTNKIIVISGAASGIGRACAELFWAAGADLVVADRDGSALDELVTDIGLTEARCLRQTLDVADKDACDELAGQVRERFGRIDALIPSAGIYRDEPFASMTAEQWRLTMTVNVDGVFNFVSAMLPLVVEGGAITLLSSRAGHSGGSKGHVHYGATKGAMLAMARGLARELGPRIRVNAVSPGVIETPMTAEALESIKDQVLAQTPLERLGSPIDIANAILFLSSDLASFITGETIQINGGLQMT